MCGYHVQVRLPQAFLDGMRVLAAANVFEVLELALPSIDREYTCLASR